MPYCQDCGRELSQSETCPDCEEPSTNRQAPTWPLAVLAVAVVVWGYGFLALQTSTGNTIAGIAVLGSLPVLYLDARWAAAAGELDVDYPIAVPVAVVLLWALTLPVYVGYRATNRE
jgi:hypothetical protein